jgi:hypothetical protein
MQNLFLVPTDKPTRLHLDSELFITPKTQLSKEINSIVEGRNIYITSDEEIKEGDWYCGIIERKPIKATKYYSKCEGDKKIILTTDPDLIADGVETISDEFLQWFVKNPSCEFVQVKRVFSYQSIKDISYYGKYFIIIPQEETKQETLEEAAERSCESITHPYCDREKSMFITGAKWQAERSYSKEEVLQIYKDYESYVIKTPITEVIEFSKWFEQNKKK